MESNAAIEISESHIERTKKLIEKRDEYVSTIFKSAKDKLIDFTNSKDYQDFMINKAKKIVDMFDMAECIVYVSSKDIAFKDQLMKLYSNILDVKEVIFIGDKGVEYQNLTLTICSYTNKDLLLKFVDYILGANEDSKVVSGEFDSAFTATKIQDFLCYLFHSVEKRSIIDNRKAVFL